MVPANAPPDAAEEPKMIATLQRAQTTQFRSTAVVASLERVNKNYGAVRAFVVSISGARRRSGCPARS